MLKIMEVHPSANPACEYLVLQNVGLVTVNLRGCVICTDGYLTSNITGTGSVSETMYIFREEIAIKPYTRVVLFTGSGEDGWAPTTDGKQAYCVCWGRSHSVWAESEQVHVLQVATSRRIPPPLLTPQRNPSEGCTFVCVGETEW